MNLAVEDCSSCYMNGFPSLSSSLSFPFLLLSDFLKVAKVLKLGYETRTIAKLYLLSFLLSKSYFGHLRTCFYIRDRCLNLFFRERK